MLKSSFYGNFLKDLFIFNPFLFLLMEAVMLKIAFNEKNKLHAENDGKSVKFKGLNKCVIKQLCKTIASIIKDNKGVTSLAYDNGIVIFFNQDNKPVYISNWSIELMVYLKQINNTVFPIRHDR